MAASPHDLIAYLASLGVETTTVEHPPLHTVEDSRALRGDIPGGHTKNLFVKDKKGPVVPVGAGRDGLWSISSACTRKSARKGASRSDPPNCWTRSGASQPGAVTPFGAINDRAGRVSVVLDEAMMRCERLNFHPLVNTSTTGLASADLVKFLRSTGHEPLVVALGQDGPAVE